MNIVILSKSTELYSTSRLVQAAELRGHTVEVIDHTKCMVYMEKGRPIVHYQGRDLEQVDAIIPRIGTSVSFFGASVVRQFEMQKVFCINGSQAILRSRDKLRSMQILSSKDVGIPKTCFTKHPKNKDVDDVLKILNGPPVVIKLLEGTQGLGVVLADTKSAAKSVIEAFSGLKTNVLIQEFISEANGEDLRAFVVGDKVVGAMVRKGAEGDFRSNLHRGGSSQLVKLTRTEKSTAIKAAKAMNLAMAGVDMLRSSRGPLVMEVNSSPGLEGIERTTESDIAGTIIEYIEQHAQKRIKDDKNPG